MATTMSNLRAARLEHSPSGESLADVAEREIQRAIINGEFPPSSRLTLPALEQRLGIGATPLREALSRLVTRGLVTMSGNRGFSVAEISRKDLDDIMVTRAVIETGALRRSMERRDAAWEDRLVAAMFRLRRTIELTEGPITEGHSEYDRAHRHFHVALIAGCGSERLIGLQAGLYDQSYRYRRILSSMGLDPQRAINEHQILVDFALGNDIDAACAAIVRHLDLTRQGVFPNGR
jgi:DNA-binding GntR family transcriptional regulator